MSTSYPTACSVQRPLFSQLGQLWLPSTNRSSTNAFRRSAVSGSSTSTFRPSETRTVHAATTAPFTLTEHTRHVPRHGLPLR